MLFAILYYGDSQIRFEGANGVSSDGLIVDKAGIEGWWSAPDLKVDVTERASGNGAHDVAADSILYASRTVTVHFDAIGDVHGEVLDAITRVSQANGMPVRLRVVDDKSDTFVSGFIRPQFGSGWNERHQTGTLTIVCPRPERLAWSPLQSQLFPVSKVQGGLLYSTVPELMSAWTGTVNASTSTLSHDGTVVATNLDTNPINIRARGGWQSTATRNSDGTWTYSLPSGDTNGTFFCAGSGNVGDVLRITFKEDISSHGIGTEGIIGLSKLDSHTIMGTINRTRSPTLNVSLGALTPLKTIRVTQSDYDAMQSLGIDWFSGDSYPIPTGKGLPYPLNYGTGGVMSNVALLLNQGSSKAYPVLTVTGPFPNGVQIQWGGNALQYDGAIGAVPLILDSRSQTASIGGVDVSRNLSRRDFPTVPANGSVSLRLMSAGTGWVTAVCRDTYI